MNYGTYTCNNVFLIFRTFLKYSQCSKGCWCFWCFFTINCYFEYRIRVRCIELYTGTCFKNMFRYFRTLKKLSQKCEQFPYGTFWGMFLGFVVPLRMPHTSWWGSLWDECTTTVRELPGTWLSESPRLLEITDFVTDFEARELIAEGVLNGLRPSTTGEGNSATTSTSRVSETTWISPNRTVIFSNLLRRTVSNVSVARFRLCVYILILKLG